MRREDLLDIIGRLRPGDITSTVLALTDGRAITLDTLIRPESEYVVVRGRESGTTDEGRAFFVPYGEIRFVKLDKPVRPNQVRRMYGEAVELDGEESHEAAAAALAAGESDGPSSSSTQPLDPAAIAKQNLLDRIRAARTSAGGVKPR